MEKTFKTFKVVVEIQVTVRNDEDIRSIATNYAAMATTYRSISAEKSEVVSIEEVK